MNIEFPKREEQLHKKFTKQHINAFITAAFLSQHSLASIDFMEMSLEDLMNVKVTSVSKKSQQLIDSAAAIHVITHKEILRSGATSVPQVLKMVPGLQVAQIDANKWAVSARGYNSRFANKLLVLIDGRSVYSPTWSGVHWEAQDIILEDVERIEVIRGPGAALWGSNAVNGVINIISKSASQTKGQMITAQTNNNSGSTAIFRSGNKLTDTIDYRVYAKYKETGNSTRVSSGQSNDESIMRQAGFRLDANINLNNKVTLQGDTYSSDIDQDRISQIPDFTQYGMLLDAPIQQKGSNLLTRWTHTTEKNDELSVQIYFDRFQRKDSFQDEKWDTFDLDIQYSTTALGIHNLTMGGGYRHKDHETEDTENLSFYPKDTTYANSNLFFQDQISFLEGRANLYIGTKLEHNQLSKAEWELQPNIRTSYRINESSMVWASIAKAIRTPSRVEQQGQLHLATAINGFPGLGPIPVVASSAPMNSMEAEELIAYETGFRVSLTSRLFIDMAFFYNDYTEQRSLGFLVDTIALAPLPPAIPTYLTISGEFNNSDDFNSKGLEFAFDWALSQSWSLKGNYSYISQSERLEQGLIPDLTNHPSEHIFNLRSSHQLSENLTLDAWIRHVEGLVDLNIDGLVNLNLESYTTLDLRLAWKPVKNLELSLVGQNLGRGDTQQYVQEILLSPDAKISSTVYAQAVWKF